MEAIVFNGLAGSGKDFLGSILCKNDLGLNHLEFKTQLYADTAAHFDLDLEEFIEAARDDVLKEEKFKDGLWTPREMLIHIAEEVVKPLWGEDHYGRVLARKMTSSRFKKFVVTDSGFIEELKPISSTAKLVIVVQVTSNTVKDVVDSRGMLDFTGYPHPNTYVMPFYNDKTLPKAETEAKLLLSLDNFISSIDAKDEWVKLYLEGRTK